MYIKLPDIMEGKIKATADYNGLTINALVIQILWNWIKGER